MHGRARPPVKEAEWQGQVEQAATLYGWIHYHTHDSRRSNRGFPDLVLVKRQRVIYAELKTRTGRLQPDQKVWLRALTVAGQEVGLWRPGDMAQVIRVLGPRGARAVLPPTLLDQLGLKSSPEPLDTSQ